jgi:hypothetical protein
MIKKDAVLCYIWGDNHAYFTTQDLNEQWGDDWNDAPYEHNAGLPYEYDRHDKEKGKKPWKIYDVYFQSDFDTPDSSHCNSPYSVESINNGATPWLKSNEYSKLKGVVIWGGCTYDEFKRIIIESGGKVFESIE